MTCKVQSWPDRNICFRVETDLETRLGPSHLMTESWLQDGQDIKYFPNYIKKLSTTQCKTQGTIPDQELHIYVLK